MPHSIEINKDLYSSVKGGSARYREHLEQKKYETVISQKEKNEILSKDMLKLKKQWCHQANNRYSGERHWKSMRLAESEQDILYLIKSNALKRRYES